MSLSLSGSLLQDGINVLFLFNLLPLLSLLALLGLDILLGPFVIGVHGCDGLWLLISRSRYLVKLLILFHSLLLVLLPFLSLLRLDILFGPFIVQVGFGVDGGGRFNLINLVIEIGKL